MGWLMSEPDRNWVLRFPAPPKGGEALPLRAVIPGLILVLAVDLAAVTGLSRLAGPALAVWNLVAALTPWATILVLRRSPSALGYVRRRAIAEYGWGMLAGAVWRGASMALGAAWLRVGEAPLPSLGAVVAGLVWVPLVEETFFRGYLGSALSARLGKPAGITIQAVLFTLQPGHWAQGWPALAGIFAFGLLAGWLVEARRTIWIGWGAHGFANVLPSLLAFLS
jgi:membrane protease YdiL (CAAX protease family)